MAGIAKNKAAISAAMPDSQFYIVFQAAAHLNRKYTAWGQVVSGMDHVDAIKKGGGSNGVVSDPDSIVTMRVAADV